MSTETIIYITIAGLAALLLALFQYIYKSKVKSNLKYFLTVLRTISIFSILLLLINPKFESLTFFDEKPTLVVAVDDSESISYLKQDESAGNIIKALEENAELNNRFNIETYSFGKSVRSLDSLIFNERQSNISQALKRFGEVYDNETAPIVLLTDGNQTYGSDYSYVAKGIKQPIYPIILGDSTIYSDLSIKQLNVNRYVFLKNRFPVEIIANYSGLEAITTELKIWSGNSVVFRKMLQFDASKTSEIISTSLNANSVGVKTYRVELVPIANEKNIVNNTKNFGVEVIDQKTNIALVADRLHPDLGTLKKSIESNEQRSVSILKPKDYLSSINDFQLVILYQPNSNFNTVLEEIKAQNLNTFTITGATTDLEFLNNTHLKLFATVTNQTEDYQPILNRNYNTFIVDNIDFVDYPPLKSEFGGLEFLAPTDVILYKSINGIKTDDAMLATYEFNNMKHAVLLGEGIWRWRAQAYLDTESFADFDNFIGKLVQYLSSNKKRKRINVDYKSFYNGNDDVSISAQYFNKNYEFDAEASLSIVLKNANNDSTREFPILLNNGNYTVDLSGIEAGEYNFTVKHNSEAIATSGSFQILEYNVEQQFLNADIDKLKSLGKNSEGGAYFSTEYNSLIKSLISDNRYATIQKSTKNIVPLIDWKYLLGLIALSLFIEWFIRKYNGLI
ncbi:VWA domain-containing protein [Winogradskyella echinorum]|uniref:VWA domain-containing protein n=1 Tax=Winogradskyella echinorum TaxID=538189 RepID=A0ABR6Y0M6_9FLAO|nr:VWA domain-containing protein [Winogradskyella echinorum]MBC3846248.1 VWA domain-containing protein [Winogradskyella echinorum]MBC5750596.1 VWA domain-containing protein [Winogradskyella echinorum]